MLKSLKWFQDHLKISGKSAALYVASVSGCREGCARISSAGFPLKVVHEIKKGLSDYMTGSDLSVAVMNMNDLEDKLQSICHPNVLKNYRFGWGKQEAVFVRQGGNTPNNVFPIFWWKKISKGVRRAIMNRT